MTRQHFDPEPILYIFHLQIRESFVYLCAHVCIWSYLQTGRPKIRNSCNEELSVVPRSQSKSQAKWPSLNIMETYPLFSLISKDKWWTLSQVPRNKASYLFQDLGNAFVCISRLEGLKTLGLIMRYLNPREKRNRCSVTPIFPISLPLQRKYFFQLQNIPSIYIYKHLFLVCFRIFMET